jgi:hypothetical protein
MFYKVIHRGTPIYLNELLPQRIGENNRHNLRNQNNFIPFSCRTDTYYCLFFPATTRYWNELPLHIRDSQSLGTYDCQIRNGCSGLNYHLYCNHVINNSTCPYCPNNQVEDPFHYFFKCVHFYIQRQQMMKELERHFHPPRLFPSTPNEFVYGNESLSSNDNLYLFKVVQNFIIRTKYLY